MARVIFLIMFRPKKNLGEPDSLEKQEIQYEVFFCGPNPLNESTICRNFWKFISIR